MKYNQDMQRQGMDMKDKVEVNYKTANVRGKDVIMFDLKDILLNENQFINNPDLQAYALMVHLKKELMK